VAPAHQYPTGVVLSPGRRAALLDWAVHNNAIVIEDNYDAEYRYDRDPVGALQASPPTTSYTPARPAKSSHPACALDGCLCPAISPAPSATKRSTQRGSPRTEETL
jgi:GntR family transcriptional regulator/MocR family aminotransferase